MLTGVLTYCEKTDDLSLSFVLINDDYVPFARPTSPFPIFTSELFSPTFTQRNQVLYLLVAWAHSTCLPVCPPASLSVRLSGFLVLFHRLSRFIRSVNDEL